MSLRLIRERVWKGPQGARVGTAHLHGARAIYKGRRGPGTWAGAAGWMVGASDPINPYSPGWWGAPSSTSSSHDPTLGSTLAPCCGGHQATDLGRPLLQAELCSPKRHAEVLNPGPQNGTLFGDGAFTEAIKLKRGHLTGVLVRRGNLHTASQGEHCVNMRTAVYKPRRGRVSLTASEAASRVLATLNSAAMNIGVHVSSRTTFYSRYMPRSGTARSYGSPIFSFFKESPSCSP